MKRKNKQAWHKKLHRHVKLMFWPHRDNHFRPHLVRRYGLLVIVFVIVVAQGLSGVWPGGAVLGASTDITTEKLLVNTNAEREKHGLPPLTVDAKLTQAAQLKAGDMLAHDYWAHVSPSGATPWDWIDQADYTFDYAGENLAKNFSTAEGTVAAWMESPDHRANVLSEHFRDVGFAVVGGDLEDQPTTLVVALYGHEASVLAQPAMTTSAPVDQPLTPIARLGVAVQSLSPVAIGSIIILILAAGVALAAHMYRRKLPKDLQRSWRRHDGLVKSAGLLSLCLLLLALYSGGQI